MSETQRFFLSRQPIVGVEGRLVAWELVFGAPDGETLSPDPSHGEAYRAALEHVGATAPWDSLLCGVNVLIRVDRHQISGDFFDRMLKHRLWLGIEPSIEVDANLMKRLRSLYRLHGARLFFFDYDRRDPREELLELADGVHVDTGQKNAVSQDMLVRRAHRRKLRVLARSVNSQAELERSCEMGFDLFQGLHHTGGSSFGETNTNIEGRALLELLLEARNGLEIDPVGRRIEENPLLAEALLRLVNSLELARSQKIESVQQALILIGGEGLIRWLSLLLFQVGDPTGNRGPLFRLAATRARLMELLVCDRAEQDPEIKRRGESGFLVGMLSMVHVLLGVERAAAIEGLPVSKEVANALTDYAGELGQLLRFAESLDAGEFPEAAALAEELSIDLVDLWSHQRTAYEWVNQMI